jgi:hypothetical protein
VSLKWVLRWKVVIAGVGKTALGACECRFRIRKTRPHTRLGYVVVRPFPTAFGRTSQRNFASRYQTVFCRSCVTKRSFDQSNSRTGIVRTWRRIVPGAPRRGRTDILATVKNKCQRFVFHVGVAKESIRLVQNTCLYRRHVLLGLDFRVPAWTVSWWDYLLTSTGSSDSTSRVQHLLKKRESTRLVQTLCMLH